MMQAEPKCSLVSTYWQHSSGHLWPGFVAMSLLPAHANHAGSRLNFEKEPLTIALSTLCCFVGGFASLLMELMA